jgi:hypothetical protein
MRQRCCQILQNHTRSLRNTVHHTPCSEMPQSTSLHPALLSHRTQASMYLYLRHGRNGTAFRTMLKIHFLVPITMLITSYPTWCNQRQISIGPHRLISGSCERRRIFGIQPLPTAPLRSLKRFLTFISVARSQAEDCPGEERSANPACEDDGYNEAGGGEVVLFLHAGTGASCGGEAEEAGSAGLDCGCCGYAGHCCSGGNRARRGRFYTCYVAALGSCRCS